MNLSHCQILWIFLNILCPGLFVIIGQLRVEIFFTEKIISKKAICSPLGHSMKQIAFRSEPFCDNQKRMKLTEKENIPCMSPQIHIMIWNVFLISY